ncbi:MAG: type II toxin-antitoxin system VapC family toxin [Euryarchaeota archaeon]|nr:type II toxin-antitoxin system VapC family toxin [Euryarchaeota archaeon]
MFLVDANIFLELQLDQKFADDCEQILRKFRDGELVGITTDFLIDSIVIVMEDNKKSPDEIKLFLTSLIGYKGLAVYSLTLSDKILATEHMKQYKLDFDDSITYQAMKSNEIKEIISYDSDFDGLLNIKRTIPSELL